VEFRDLAVVMKKTIAVCLPMLGMVAFTSSVEAATLYVSPTGTAITGCDRSARCDLASAASTAAAGDTVILMDGVYNTQLVVTNSGTSSAWITFQADECATPIIEGAGVGPMDTNQDTGVGSATASYVRFIGLVSRGWSTGFGNGWTGTDTTTSNGHFEYQYCIADGNGRTGFTFFSAQGITLQNSIAAHNGSSQVESWSSGITLYEAQGSAGDSVIQGNVSFENMDGQQHTDGSGFIIDEYSNGATFLNNIAFRNGGSCLRLTKSSNCSFINNTCYHDAQDTQDNGPTNPSEIYFTNNDSSTTTGVSFMNNVVVATGTGPGAMAVYNQPTSGWSNNQVATGTVSYFTSADATADFTLAASSTLAGKGAAGAGVPTNDIGFDPKCITNHPPTMVGSIAKGSWWQYSVDVAYIQKIGGVAKCFNPKSRSGTPDIGAYANGAVTASSGTCIPSVTGTAGSGGATGAAGNSAGGVSAGGANSAGGVSAGGTSNSGGATSSGGTVATFGGSSNKASGSSGTSTGSSAGGSSNTGNPMAGSPNANGTGGSAGDSKSGCSCGVAGQSTRSSSEVAFGLLGLAMLGLKRRRRAR
jgi:MYXO-CTERM domain-containing protein